MIPKEFEPGHGHAILNREINMMNKKDMVKPAGIAGKAILTVLLFYLAGLLSACGGSKLIKNPVPIELTTHMEQATLQVLHSMLLLRLHCDWKAVDWANTACKIESGLLQIMTSRQRCNYQIC